MRFLTLFIIVFALYSCEEAQENASVESPSDEVETSTKDFLTEVITRTYSVKKIDNKTTIDTLQQIQSVTIDSEGKEIENTFYDLDMTVSWIDRYIYNEDGNKIGSNYFDKGTDNTIFYVYKIDEKGRKTSYQAFDYRTSKVLYDGATRYVHSGKMKKDGYINQEGDFVCNFEYLYNDDGSEEGYVYIDNLSNERFPSIYEYIDFNTEDEWVKRNVISNGKVQSIETREFVKKEIKKDLVSN